MFSNITTGPISFVTTALIDAERTEKDAFAAYAKAYAELEAILLPYNCMTQMSADVLEKAQKAIDVSNDLWGAYVRAGNIREELALAYA